MKDCIIEELNGLEAMPSHHVHRVGVPMVAIGKPILVSISDALVDLPIRDVEVRGEASRGEVVVAINVSDVAIGSLNCVKVAFPTISSITD